MYTFKQLEKMLNKKLNYAFYLTYKNKKYVLQNLENNTTKYFYSRIEFENFVFSEV